MIRKEFDDGLIEMTIADSHGGPDNCFSELNVNSYALFVRKDGGEWQAVRDIRSQLQCKLAIDACALAEDVMSKLTKGDSDD